MHIGTQLLFQDAVKNFCLAVGLWMVSRTHPEFSTTQTKKLAPKATDEDGVSIRDQAFWKPMKLTDQIEE